MHVIVMIYYIIIIYGVNWERLVLIYDWEIERTDVNRDLSIGFMI